MIDPASDRKIPISPQLALRVAILGVGAFVLFAIIFFRLWYLQVLSGEQYLREAQVNRVRTERVNAPRGAIVDRKGVVLVRNEPSVVVTIDPRSVPDVEKTLANTWGRATARRGLRKPEFRGPQVKIPEIPTEALRVRFRELGKVLGMKGNDVQERVITGLWLAPYAPIKIKTGVADEVNGFLRERPDAFPGVKSQPVFLRNYPEGSVAAQIFGGVGSISPKQLESGEFKGVTAGQIIGTDGIERQYDRYLRGEDGVDKFLVDAQGNRKGSATSQRPVAGHELKLTIDAALQRAGQRALGAFAAGKPGAFVAMNPNNGEVYAIGSLPTFDPNLLSRPITQDRFESLFGTEAGSPLVNRAISGAYPTGSTFKPITALAGLSTGLITTTSPFVDEGCLKVGRLKSDTRCNAGDPPEVNGTVELRSALKVSSDVYFYKIGLDANPLPNQVIQTWAHKLGMGQRTGIDLPGEFGGLIPDSAWRKRIAKEELACRKDKKISPRADVYAAGRAGCGISDMRGYTAGDNVNLSVGQGDLQATPLQLAVVYATIANGGKVVRPHLGYAVADDAGRQLQRLPAGASRSVKIDPNDRSAIMDGLHESASLPGGTSTDVFTGWPQARYPIYGKTGTAERLGRPDDQSWYAAYVPAGDKSIVIVATVEDGGFGAEAAAPAVCRMLRTWLDVKGPKCSAGSSITR